MSGVALAHLERPRALALWAWALLEQDVPGGRSEVRTLASDGTPTEDIERALAQRVGPPVGAAGWLAPEGDARLTPCVVVGMAQDGRRLRLLTPHGTVEAAADRVRPASAPGVLPGAAGPAVVTARTGLAKTSTNARRFALRWATTWLRGVHERDGLGGATWIDVALLPHQLSAVRAALEAPTVRQVLADEVGLGKTVEALMIWSALSAHECPLRCVIAAPRSLVAQWCLEVRRRAEHRLLARAAEDLPPVYVPGAPDDAMDADNPRGIVVTEHDALGALRARAAVIDMLIIDEAHTLNAEQRDAVETIARSARHLLLLTATPREGRRGSGAAREFRKGFAWAAGLVDPKWPPPDLPEEDVERALDQTVDASFQRGRECDAALAQAGGDAASSLLNGEAVGALAEILVPSHARGDLRAFMRHSTLFERVVRSRRRSIGDGLTATRRLVRVPVEYRDEEVAVLDAVRGMEPSDRAAVIRQACSSWDALAGMSGGRTAALRARLDVIRDARVGRRPDAKLEALLDLCASIWDGAPDAKVVVRCEYVETRELVSQQLRRLLTSGGLRRSTQGEMDAWQGGGESVGPVARLEQGQDAMLEALRNPTEAGRSMLAQIWAFERFGEGGAAVLVAGDVASTGLNLQFASDLILYDLPWTPGLAEQWIGRLDRVGQRAGEVRVYAMSHRALPTERMLDVYESIGLFDGRGYHVSQEVERRINDLLRPTDSDESTWDESVREVQRLIDTERESDDDVSRGASLDLPPTPPPPQGDARRAIRGFVQAAAAAGFTIDGGRDGSTQVQWPLADVDALWLPGVAAALRPPETVGRRSTPEDIAASRERGRRLLITDRRLGDGRWVRASSVALFSPRHPLFAEVEEEMLRDPSLALGAFRCSSAAAKTPPGVYLLVQSQTQPALGGSAMAWRCGVPPAALQDEELSRFWVDLDAALRRMMRVRCRAELSQGAWLVSSSGGAPQPQPPERLDALLSALPAASARPAASAWGSVEPTLAAMERPSDALLSKALAVAAAVAADVTRDAALRLDRIVARRQGAIAAAGVGDAWRGMRDARARAVDAARALRSALDDLPSQARHGAVEAATPRAVAAAVVEVHL